MYCIGKEETYPDRKLYIYVRAITGEFAIAEKMFNDINGDGCLINPY